MTACCRARIGAILGLPLLLLANVTHGAIIDAFLPVSLPKALGGTAIDRGTYADATTGNWILVPPASSAQVETQRVTRTSNDQAMQFAFDANSDLGNTGFSGMGESTAGGDQSRAGLDLSGIAVDPGPDGAFVSGGAIEYSTLRLEAAGDFQVSVDFQYSMRGNVSPDLLPPEAVASALNVLWVIDPGAFIQTGEDANFVTGFASIPLFEFLPAGAGMPGALSTTTTINLMTNRDYLVQLGSLASISIGGPSELGWTNPAMDLLIGLSIEASAELHSVSTRGVPGVELVRTTVRPPAPVHEPPAIGLILLFAAALLHSVYFRRKRDNTSPDPA